MIVIWSPAELWLNHKFDNCFLYKKLSVDRLQAAVCRCSPVTGYCIQARAVYTNAVEEQNVITADNIRISGIAADFFADFEIFSTAAPVKYAAGIKTGVTYLIFMVQVNGYLMQNTI